MNFDQQRLAKMESLARECLSREVAIALLHGNLRDREVKKIIPKDRAVIDLIVAGILIRNQAGLRLAKEAIPVVGRIAKGE